MHRKVAAALVAALALGVASCGSSEPLTRAELVRKVEVACREGQQQAQKQMRAGERSSRDGTTRLVSAFLIAEKSILARIEDLDVSDATKSDFDAFKAAVKQRADLFARVDGATGAELRRAMAEAQAEGEAIGRRLHDSAAALGIEGCT